MKKDRANIEEKLTVWEKRLVEVSDTRKKILDLITEIPGLEGEVLTRRYVHRENFKDDDDILCALDLIFDDATVFYIKGDSFRGKKLETVSLKTSRVKTPNSTESPNI